MNGGVSFPGAVLLLTIFRKPAIAGGVGGRGALFSPQMAQANCPHFRCTLHLCRLFQNVGKQMIVSVFVAV